MKILFAILITALLMGCSTKTKINFETTTVRGYLVFPKDTYAKDLKLEYYPETKILKFSASELRTSASAVRREQNVGVVAVSGAVSDVAKTAAPLLLP